MSIALSCLAVALAGCGGGSSGEAGGATAAEAREATEAKVPRGTPAEAAKRPEARVPRGETTQNLVVRDLVRGTGPAAEAGQILMIRFVGGIYETGEKIETVVKEPIGFLLGGGDWPIGWETGMPGMRVGGRRELIFPTTPGALPPRSELGDTLVYVVDLLEIRGPEGATSF